MINHCSYIKANTLRKIRLNQTCKQEAK